MSCNGSVELDVALEGNKWQFHWKLSSKYQEKTILCKFWKGLPYINGKKKEYIKYIILKDKVSFTTKNTHTHKSVFCEHAQQQDISFHVVVSTKNVPFVIYLDENILFDGHHFVDGVNILFYLTRLRLIRWSPKRNLIWQRKI